jgi:molybdenum cofactor biosynthesis enzyme
MTVLDIIVIVFITLEIKCCIRFEVLTAVSIEIVGLWNMIP